MACFWTSSFPVSEPFIVADLCHGRRMSGGGMPLTRWGRSVGRADSWSCLKDKASVVANLMQTDESPGSLIAGIVSIIYRPTLRSAVSVAR